MHNKIQGRGSAGGSLHQRSRRIVFLVIASQLGVGIAIALSLAVVAGQYAAYSALVGALIGVSFRTPEEATSVGRLLTILMLTMGPVLIPADRLPDWLVWLGFLSPATYAASALRQALLGPLTNRLLLDVAALLLFIFLSFWMVNRRMDWRER